MYCKTCPWWPIGSFSFPLLLPPRQPLCPPFAFPIPWCAIIMWLLNVFDVTFSDTFLLLLGASSLSSSTRFWVLVEETHGRPTYVRLKKRETWRVVYSGIWQTVVSNILSALQSWPSSSSPSIDLSISWMRKTRKSDYGGRLGKWVWNELLANEGSETEHFKYKLQLLVGGREQLNVWSGVTCTWK